MVQLVPETMSCLIILSVFRLVKSISVKSCSFPLGMESGVIKDSQITASSSFASSVGPSMGRLRSTEGGGAWCPATMVSNYSKEWLEVDMEKKMMITGISLQGRWDNGVGQEFSPFVILMYFDDVTEEFTTYSDIDGEHVMAANTDTYSVAEFKMVTAVLTDRIRVIIPYSHHQWSVCLRVEVMGCKVPQKQEMRVEQLMVVGKKIVVEKGIAVEEFEKWGMLPIVIGILLTTSIILMVMIIYMCMRMNKGKQETTEHQIYPTGQNSSNYQHEFFLQSEEPIYQEPMLQSLSKQTRIRHNKTTTFLLVTRCQKTLFIPSLYNLHPTLLYHQYQQSYLHQVLQDSHLFLHLLPSSFQDQNSLTILSHFHPFIHPE